MSDAGTMMRYDAMKKSPLIAYLLWWFLGMFGAHRFYTGQTGSAIAMLSITLCSFPLMFVLIGFVTFFIVAVWWLVDAFLIYGWVTEHNMQLASSLDRR